MSASTGGRRQWSDLTSAELSEAVRADPVVLLPIAAIEQHGPHLPLSTDADIGRGLIDEALSRLDPETPVLRLPMQVVGTSEEHVGLPGTLSLAPMRVVELLVDLGRSVAVAGARRIVIVNSHGGNRAAIDLAALRLRREHGLLVVKAHWFRFPRPAADQVPELPTAEWTHGLHGGAVETAMMLHLRPDLVRRDRLARFRSLGEDLAERLSLVAPEGVAPFAWIAQDLHPQGVAGDASCATEALGATLVRHYGAVLAEVVRDTRAFPLDALNVTP